jgi:hypothetical protein
MCVFWCFDVYSWAGSQPLHLGLNKLPIVATKQLPTRRSVADAAAAALGEMLHNTSIHNICLLSNSAFTGVRRTRKEVTSVALVIHHILKQAKNLRVVIYMV